MERKTGLITNRVAQLPVEVTDGKRHWSTYAKGAPKQRGVMNKTETAFLNEFILPLVAAEVVTWWEYELCSYALTVGKPKLDDKRRVHFLPDFHLLHHGYMHIYEVKGSGIIPEASLMRVKLLADKLPYHIFIATRRRQRDGGGWDIQEY
jgi:hypothetical protein